MLASKPSTHVRGTSHLQREKQIVALMIEMFCRGHHGTLDMSCKACRELHDYAMCRLDRCPFGEQKPDCAKCEIHCYRADMREQVRAVMRYSGVRLLLRHPLLYLAYRWHGLRKGNGRRRLLSSDD